MAIMDLFTSLQTIINERSAKKVRQSIHDGIFRANQVVDANKNLVDQVAIRQDAVEQYNNQMIAEMTDKDVISAPELIQIRDGEATANARLDRDFGSINSEISDIKNNLSVIAISVKDFGAVGNGLVDDTLSINSAIEQLRLVGGGNLIIPAGEYLIDDGGLICCDNLNIIMSADTVLRQIPNNKLNYRTIDAQGKKNITISGGQLVGDRYAHYFDDIDNPWKKWTPSTLFSVGDIVYRHHIGYRVTNSGVTGNTAPSGGSIGTIIENGAATLSIITTNVGEWGFGIYINDSENITINNILIRDYWGDGIYIGDRHHDSFMVNNVSISNVRSYNNRRQGLSVSAVNGLFVRDSEFSHTNGTLPEAGIDFEPNIDANQINNVYLENIKLENNATNSLIIDFRAITTGYKLNFLARDIICSGPSSVINIPTASMSGFIKMLDYSHSSFTTNAFYITKADNGLNLIIDSPIITTGENYTYAYDDYGSCFVLGESGSSVIGGVSIIRPRINIAGSPTVKPKNILSIISNGQFTTKVNNLSIINPLEVTGVVRGILRVTNRLEYLKNFEFVDNLGICTLTLTRLETYPNYYAPNIYNLNLSGKILNLSRLESDKLVTKIHNLGTDTMSVDTNPVFPLLSGNSQFSIPAKSVGEVKIMGDNTYLSIQSYT